MEKELFIKVWRKLLIDLDMSEAQAAKAVGQSPANLNKKIVNGSIRLLEFSDILEAFGYELKIVKKE